MMFKTKNNNNIVYKCTVRLLEDTDIVECEFQSFHKGSYLMEYLCEQLEIHEKDYFGLRYVDAENQKHWLDLAKSIVKQCKNMDPILFSLRVKFYPSDPFRFTGNGRYMLYQQLKRDLLHGRLCCSVGEAATLGSLIVQEELGDFKEEVHVGDYIASMHLAQRQTIALEKKIIELHKKRGPDQDPTTTISEFMRIARDLETYGIDPYPVKDHRGSQLYIGINYSGISTFASGKRLQHFRWNEVHKLNFEGKMFIAHLSYTDASREPKKHTVGFKCSSGVTCRYIWRCATEQMLFFTLPSSQNVSVISGGGFFSWGAKFKYTGRTERDIITETINELREQKLMNSTVCKRKVSSMPATPSSPQGDVVQQIRYRSLPRSAICEPTDQDILKTSDYLEPVSEEIRQHALNFQNRNSITNDVSNYSLRGPSKYDRDDVKSVQNRDEKHNMSCQPQQQRILLNFFKPKSASTTYAPSSNVLEVNFNIDNQNINSIKNVRKFHIFYAFIPSLLFVIFVITLSAIVILESESKLFEQIRNMPEMMSLKHHYYHPLKKFLFQQLISY